MMGSVKSIIRSTLPSTGTFTVSNHSGREKTSSILGIGEKVNLMNVERVDLVRVVHHSPTVKCSDGYAGHRRIRRTIFLAVDVEALLVFGEGNHKVRRAILNPVYQLSTIWACKSGPGARLRAAEDSVSAVAQRLPSPPAPLPDSGLHQDRCRSKAYEAMLGSSFWSGDDCFDSTRRRNQDVAR